MRIKRLFLLFIRHLFSIVGSLLMVLLEFCVIIETSGRIYVINNPVPEGVVDLGVGFVGLASLIVSCFFAIPVFYFTYRFIYRRMKKLIGVDKEDVLLGKRNPSEVENV